MFGDEGAANQCRITSAATACAAMELFASRDKICAGEGMPVRPIFARQAVEASAHRGDDLRVGWGNFVSSAAGPQGNRWRGAFRNDVVAVSSENVLLLPRGGVRGIAPYFWSSWWPAATPSDTSCMCSKAKSDELTLCRSRRDPTCFNSQIVTLPCQGGMALILPHEVEETPRAKAYVDRVLATNGPIREAHYFDLRQSMRNGGGQACLRLRVVLTPDELAALGGRRRCSTRRAFTALEDIVKQRYRDPLSPADLADPALLDEGRTALDEIGQVLGLGSVHDFQRI